MTNKISELKEILRNDRVCIMSHIMPDGDCVGSLLGFGLSVRRQFGDNIRLSLLDEVPKSFKFLEGVDLIEKEVDFSEIDTLILLDCGDLLRIGDKRSEIHENMKVVNIDHHISNENYGDINIVDIQASSTCEIVYDVLTELDVEVKVDAATCIYTGMSTDTGSFKYNNTTPKTLNIASKLLGLGVNIDDVTVNAYQSRTLEKTSLFIESLKHMELHFNNRFAVTYVDMDMYERSNANPSDSDGIVEYLRDIDTVEVSCLLKQISEEEIKVSMRAKTDVDVSEISVEFGGGGHKRAAGFTLNSDVQTAKATVIDRMKNIYG